jgi:hypothetical protein
MEETFEPAVSTEGGLIVTLLDVRSVLSVLILLVCNPNWKCRKDLND